MARSAPLAVTMGEPAGIGGELTLAAWRARSDGAVPPFFVLDDPDRLDRLARALAWAVPVHAIDAPERAAAVWPDALPVLPLSGPVAARPGSPGPDTAPAVLESIDRAVALALAGSAGAIVTQPIQKSVLYEAGFRHPGHTEYLAALTGADRSVMMLAVAGLRVVPLTIHVPLAQVPGLITAPLIAATARILNAALMRDFAISRPRIAVAGLNPHAGEDGTIGTEERIVIAPALEGLRAEGLDLVGPLPADSLFHEDARAGIDAVLCMYHDQALIPLKTLDFWGGVNITLGLPIVRASPDHGTALDLAGRGEANPLSFFNALRQAARMAEARARAR